MRLGCSRQAHHDSCSFGLLIFCRHGSSVRACDCVHEGKAEAVPI